MGPALEKAGVHVVYGLVGLKTHTKTALVVREEADGIRRYCHIGTGNYNPKTARLYEDLGLLTGDPDIGADLTQLFNFLTGYGRDVQLPPAAGRAPRRCAASSTELIEQRDRIARRRARPHHPEDEQPGRPPTDRRALRGVAAGRARSTSSSGASAACGRACPGLSENIRVRSIVGRYLEHSRIYRFANGAAPRRARSTYIGSADLMPRNLDRRVEALVPVDDAARCRTGSTRSSTSTWPTTPWPGSSARRHVAPRATRSGTVDTHVRLQDVAPSPASAGPSADRRRRPPVAAPERWRASFTRRSPTLAVAAPPGLLTRSSAAVPGGHLAVPSAARPRQGSPLLKKKSTAWLSVAPRPRPRCRRVRR